MTACVDLRGLAGPTPITSTCGRRRAAHAGWWRGLIPASGGASIRQVVRHDECEKSRRCESRIADHAESTSSPQATVRIAQLTPLWGLFPRTCEKVPAMFGRTIARASVRTLPSASCHPMDRSRVRRHRREPGSNSGGPAISSRLTPSRRPSGDVDARLRAGAVCTHAVS